MFRKIIIPLLVVLITMVGALALAGPEGSVRGGDRDRTPVLSVKDFNLQAYEGKVVLIGFWQRQGPQCEDCEAYISWLTRMQESHGKEGLVIVAVNQDQVETAALDLMKLIHPRIQVVMDPTGKMGSRYELEGIPSSYMYDRNLNMQAKFVGFVPEETEAMEKEIVKLLKKKYKD
ncbi:MAG: TlpA family protein disulfide reductase [Candidatus Krumholzibacteria bacterium]|nr:TlpA family protein disulfide reductase [Candidatus Krumholzibacteria bacterium]